MTAPVNNTVLRLTYSSEDELNRKLIVIMQRRGFVVTRANHERVTVGELAQRLGRNLTNVSTRLRSPYCPAFVCGRGKRRILWLEPNEQLLSYLRNTTKGQRSDLTPSIEPLTEPERKS